MKWMLTIWQWLAYLFKPARLELSALVLGGISVFAFAPFEIAPLIVLTLASLFALWWRADSVRHGFKLGLWFGLGLFGAGASWLFSSLYIFADVWLPLSIFLTFLFVLYLSLFIAVAGALSVYLRGQSPFYFLMTLPAVWVLMELIRGSFLDGYPFLLVGNSHVQTWLDGYAPVLGVWGVSFAVVLTAAALFYIWQKRAWLGGALVIAGLWLSGSMLQKVEWVQPLDKPIEVALLQGNIAQEKKWLPSEFYPTMQTYISLTKQNLGADVIVWPETAVPAYFDVVQRGALRSFIADVQLLKKDVLVGTIAGDIDSADYYNALVNLRDPEQKYYKHHLVPFSEYFPFDDLFRFMAQAFEIPYATFSAGSEQQPPMMLGGYQAGLSICFEMAFGEELAQQLPEAKYLITVSNDAWFANTLEPAQQLQEVQMRALELGREIARSTNTGHTAIVGKDGVVKARIAPYQEGVLKDKVQPYEGMTPYAQWQRLPIILILLAILAVPLSRLYLRRRY